MNKLTPAQKEKLMHKLKELGLIEGKSRLSGRDHWKLTSAGEQLLAEARKVS